MKGLNVCFSAIHKWLGKEEREVYDCNCSITQNRTCVSLNDITYLKERGKKKRNPSHEILLSMAETKNQFQSLLSISYDYCK